MDLRIRATVPQVSSSPCLLLVALLRPARACRRSCSCPQSIPAVKCRQVPCRFGRFSLLACFHEYPCAVTNYLPFLRFRPPRVRSALLPSRVHSHFPACSALLGGRSLLARRRTCGVAEPRWLAGRRDPTPAGKRRPSGAVPTAY